MQKHNSSSRLRLLIEKILFVYLKIFGFRKLINKKMEGKYSPNKIALVVTLGVGLIWFFMLMWTPAHGLADDGSYGTTMARNGLSYIQTEPEEIYNNYFIRTYALDMNYDSQNREIKNSQDVVITIAITIDELITNNDYFDIRFLAAIYGVFYLLGIFLFIKNIFKSMYHFSEAVVIAVFSVLIFGDISYLAYFNSLYPEAIWMICFIYIVGAICAQQFSKTYWSLLTIFAAGTVLCLSRQQCGFIGIIIAMYLLRAMFFYKNTLWKVFCVGLTFLMSLVGIFSIYTLNSDFSLTSKYHSMTRGVLFQTSNPETTLTELGINPSYSVLANNSAYNYYPLVLPDNVALQEGFLNEFDQYDIALYYLKNPGAFLNMMDIAIKDTMDLRRDFSGNFEQSANMPQGAKSIMWSFWSFFKQRSMPKTIGFFFLLIIAAYIFYTRISREKDYSNQLRNRNILFYLILFIIGVGVSQAMISIIMSGAAELGQHAFLMGATMDMMIFLLFAEVLPRMNILEKKEHEG